MAGFAAYVKLPTNAILAGIKGYVNKKVQYIKKDSQVYYEILDSFKDIVEHRVPMETGALRGSATIITQGGGYALEYDPVDPENGFHYGSKQYHGPVVGSRVWDRHTSGTGGYWDKNLPQGDMRKLMSAAKRAVKNSWEEAK